MEKADMKIAPSTPTSSIAATISSPVTCSGQFGTLCQGRFGVFASYTWTWESMIVIGMLLCVPRVWLSQPVRVQRAQASCVAEVHRDTLAVAETLESGLLPNRPPRTSP